MNKREFMLGTCALVGTVRADGGPSAPCTGANPTRAARPPELAPDLASAKWQRYVGDEFAASGGRLRLSEVRAGPSPDAWPAASSEQFGLIFTGTAALTAGTHALLHGTGQRIALFMQPAGPSAQGQAQYRADFNLLV